MAFAMVAGALPAMAAPAAPKGRAEHVVVLVWDGMRPDFISPQYCPHLYSLATNGVFFKNHHCVYISSTEVNGTALATGVHPGRSRVIANAEYRPEISFTGNFATEALDAIRRGDLMSDGHYLGADTLAEILQDNGIATVIAGSKPVALLHDRSAKKNSAAEKESTLLFEGKTIPRSAGEGLPKVNDDKAWPSNAVPNTAQDLWTTRSLIRALWKKTVPKYSLLWLSDPDKSQHDAGVGSPNALAGIDSSDKNLGEVIKALKERGVFEKTDIFVVSDHGFSTISKGPDIVDILKKAKFQAFKKNESPEPGDVIVVSVGGAAMLYVVDRQEAVVRRLVDFLQQSDFAGVIFSRVRIEGTFPFEVVRYESGAKDGPDVLVSLRWTADRNDYGAPGMFYSVEGTKGKGSHASLSRFDMHNTLVAAGPDLKRGFINQTASGNIDLAPTVLHLLGISPPKAMDGRVLLEALEGSGPAPRSATKRLDATRDVGIFRWSQYLQFTEVDGATYFDEGNGAPEVR
jgi:arylsulfatase A-like enzyme